ncbi:BTAD domain-containing putative transcriptional regulator [Actinospica acidithermotolerans]|nr:BTAD domain-containing putative transcriptional regulator [Actinospica acidithermotolerans]
MVDMRFGLLGPLTVQLEAECAPVRIEQRMPEILLAALLLNAGKTVPTVKLTTALWGYDPPPSAASSLYNHVGRLRRLLGVDGAARIRNASVGYVIDVGSEEMDIAEFAALCAEGGRMRESADWPAASEKYAAALSLWRGEPAEGVSGLEEWQARVQELREMRLQALDARIDCDLRLGRHRQTTAELQALALEYPLHESFHKQLMLALYRGGRQTDALNAFQRLRQSLSHELGIDPSAAVQRLYQAMLNADPALDAFGGDPVAVDAVPVVDGAEAVESAEVVEVADSPAGAPEQEGLEGLEVRRTMVAGIPVLFGPALPGARQRAGITFRVGMADEPLARAGITHLIEHLALHGLGPGDVHHNGVTSATVTHFLMQGSADEAVEFIHSVCKSLHDLPFERLETEKSILDTEASHRGLGWTRHLAASRYGAGGYGIPGFGELGLPALTPDDLRAWVSKYFTRENAVLWFSGDEVPAGLDPQLPAGRRMPLPLPSSVLPTTPAYISGGPQGVVGLSAVVRRGPAANLFTELLERELFKRLRHEGGLSYAISADYAARDAEYAEIHATADALPAMQEKLIRALINLLAELREGDVDPEALEAVRSRALEAHQAPNAAVEALPGLAADLLLGRPHTREADLLDEFRATTAHDVHNAAAEALGSALLILPGRSLDADAAGYAAVSSGSAVTAIGDTYRAHDDPSAQLVVGASAVSLHRNGAFATVQYAECVAMQAWPDGARRLWSRDGSQIAIEPGLFDAPPGFLAPLDASIPPERVIRQPPRDPRQIPMRMPGTPGMPGVFGMPGVPGMPSTPGTPGAAQWRDQRPTQTVAAKTVQVLVRIAFWTFLVATILFTAISIIVTFDTDPADDVTIGVIVFIWLFNLGVCVLPTYLLGRRVQRYKEA